MIFKKIMIISSLCITVNLNGTLDAKGSHALNLPNEVVQALTNGDAKTISNYFNTSVELIFSERQAVYGKAHAEQILRTFFNDNATANRTFSYKPLHNGTRNNAQFSIGELTTGKGSYRVTIFLKDQQILQMKIESND